MEALGYRRMPAAGGPHSVLVVNAARFSEVLLSARSGTMMARLIPSVVRRVHLGVFSLRSGSRLRVQPVYAADPAFDAFWQRTRQQYPNVTVRNAAWVDWQCFTSRSFAKDVVAAYDGPELCGFAIGVTLNTKSLRILDCVDMWYEFRRLNVAVALMRGLADVAVARNYDAVQMPHFSGPIEKALRGRGLLRVVRDPIVGYWRGSKTWMSGSNTDNTYLTTIEGDRFL
jgi:hypothetical protein